MVMSTWKLRFVVTVWVGILLFAAPVQGQATPDPLFGLGDREVFTVRSESLGRDFHVLVRLPRSYGETARSYPMAFLLDGGILFPMLAPYQLMLEAEGTTGEVIVVGISYGGLGYANGNLRGTDYTAPSPDVEYFGGADRFAQFLADQLLPRLQHTYRIDPDRRMLFGQSLGGQFAIHAALTRPELFSTYVAINPAIHANLPFFLELQPVPADPPTRLVMAMGSEDDARYRDTAQAWLAAWQGRDARPFDLDVIEIEGAYHATTAPAAYAAVIRAQVGSEGPSP